MWLLTKHGAYSIVKKGESQFHVRARVRRDLENLVDRMPLPGAVIHFSRTTDYPFRLIVGGDEVLKIMQFLGETLDYKNFKDTVSSTPDQRDKHSVYGQVWHLLLDKFGGYGKNVSEHQK